MQSKFSEPQCLKCSHYIKNTSCGSCADEGAEIVKNIFNASGNSTDNLFESEDLNLLKYSCKVVMNSSEDFNVVDPLECRYYLPSVLRLF